MEYIALIASPLGPLTIRFSNNAITGLWLPNQKYFPDLSGCILIDSHPMIDTANKWLNEYFLGNQLPLPPLQPNGSPFQLSVWNILKTIPPGTTLTYGEIAKAIGNPKASQAVGNAVSRNPISIMIPCHRVVGTSGKLTGYAGGLNAKKYLLELEKA